MAYGYRVGEVKLKAITMIKPDFIVERFFATPEYVRKPMQVSIGMNLVGSVLPHPDTYDSQTLLAGTCARFATQPPVADVNQLHLLRLFVTKWLKDNITPLAPDTDISFDSWIAATDYPEWRKKELRDIHISSLPLTRRDAEVKMFMKKETYTDFKHGRAINSRTDRFKVHVGPTFRQIEKVLFSRQEFIKKIPVPDRPQFIWDKLNKPGCTYYASDFTSFESLFTRQIMEAVEFQLYEFCTKDMPSGREFMKTVRKYLGGKNKIRNKNMSVSVRATRMSGEMCTSLGNSFSNLMFNYFLAESLGSKIVGVVEGDDGLFRIEGPVPTIQDFSSLGLIVKLEQHDAVNSASFCGQLFHPDAMRVITDPRKVLASFGWLDGKYILCKKGVLTGLLRAKAWSLGYQYPACPILSALARAALRLTRSYDHRVILKGNLNAYDRKMYEEAFAAGRPQLTENVSVSTRALMYQVFGVSPETQHAVEAYLDGLTSLCSLDIDLDTPENWKIYSSRYVMPLGPLHDVPPTALRRCFPTPMPVGFIVPGYTL